MSIVLGLLAAVLGVLAIAAIFLRSDPRQLAGGLRAIVPALLGVAGLVLVTLGKAGLGGAMLAGALAWFTMGRWRRPPARRLEPPRATVRTAGLEMELDNDTGALEGLVLAGRHESKTLGSMSLAQLVQLYAEVGTDPETRQLLETYLDGRFPVWRNHVETDNRDRHGVAPGTGTMTKEEAYKVLGLEAGATATDIRQAHRRLMQRLHPDVGGTSVLAARINEAKDVLLSDHG